MKLITTLMFLSNKVCHTENLEIKNNEYHRLDTETKNKLINKEKSSVIDFVKNPIIIKNSNNYETISEKVLQKIILEDI